MYTYGQKKKQQATNQKHQSQHGAGSLPPIFQSNQLVNEFISQQRGDAEQSTPERSGVNPDLQAAMQRKMEKLTGYSFDDVRVHRNSDKPAELGALAYTQGNNVYIGPGQEEHLEHELGHVAQQKAGMVRATGKIENIDVNDDKNLEETANFNVNKLHFNDLSHQDENHALSSDNIIQMQRSGDTSSSGSNQNNFNPHDPMMKRLRSQLRQTNINTNRITAPPPVQMPAQPPVQPPVSSPVQTPTPKPAQTPAPQVIKTRTPKPAKKSIARKATQTHTPKPVKKPIARKTAQISEISKMPKIPDDIRGVHGRKDKEQKILSKKYGSDVTGKTHESEHAIGYAVVKKPKSARGADSVARQHENILPAYQEVRPLHRDHIGTGSRTKEEEKTGRFGFETDESYRTAQYTAISDKETDSGVSNAIQLNQLGYSRMYENINKEPKSVSNDPVYKSRKKGKITITQNSIDQADNSYFNMVKTMTGWNLVYYEGNKLMSRAISKKEAAEMILARITVRTKQYPSEKIENMVRKEFNLDEIDSISSDDIDNSNLIKKDQDDIDKEQEKVLSSMKK